MLIKVILSYILGYVKIAVEGYYLERFINICNNKKITIWNLKKDKNVKLDLNVRIQDFKNICKIAKKTGCKVKINKKCGLPFFMHRYKKRKIFAFLLSLLVVLIIASSNFIWNVEIRLEDGEKIENLEQDLEENGLKIGELKAKVNTKEIINKIRLKRTDIAWIGIELKGTNAIVKVIKADEKPEIINEEEYCNIVSNKVGIITKINAQNGTANVKVGDTVNVGTTLINGWMEGKYTGIRYVHAKGEIEAKVWYTKSKKVYFKQEQKEETGELENKYSIKINNFEINFNKKLSKFKIYDTINAEKKFKIFSDFYLPISIVKTTYKEQKNVEKIYSVEEAKSQGIKELEEEIEKEIENKESILNKNINVYQNEDSIDVYVTYEVLENIGTKEKIVF